MKQRALTKMLDRGAKLADNLLGPRAKAKLIHRTYGEMDVITGVQAYSDSITEVVLRSWPLSIRERIDLVAAGLQQVDARWTLRVAYASQVNTDDMLKVGDWYYEVLPGGVTKDEFEVEWTILTRRKAM